jgi:hypothetical protein
MTDCSCVQHTMEGPANKGEQYRIITCACDCVIHCVPHIICPLSWDYLYASSVSVPNHKNLSTKNIPTHYGSGIMYGIEIEVETEDQNAVLDRFLLGDYYVVKLDMSVPGGLEFVSAPMSFYTHCVQMRKLYAWFDELNAGGKKTVWVSNKTGIHFHIQKEKVSSYNLRWLSDYLTGNQHNTDMFAGRKPNRFCARNGDIANTTKTSAIRITKDTIELRIFASFMDYENVIQRLAIVNMILHSL